jgi:hypothetical protein
MPTPCRAYGSNKNRKCEWCGAPLTGRQRRWCCSEHGMLWYRTHIWSTARKVALKRDGYHCVREGCKNLDVEVNHKVPIKGKHAKNGCHHHTDGLETLCHEHHVDETNRQFGRGKYREQ